MFIQFKKLKKCVRKFQEREKKVRGTIDIVFKNA